MGRLSRTPGVDGDFCLEGRTLDRMPGVLLWLVCWVGLLGWFFWATVGDPSELGNANRPCTPFRYILPEPLCFLQVKILDSKSEIVVPRSEKD